MNTTLARPKTISLTWLAAWTLASALGIIAGFIIVLPLLWTIGEQVGQAIGQFPAQILGGIVFGLGVSAAVGFGQWLVLRGRTPDATRWLVGSLVGGIVGGVLAIIVSLFNDGGENVAVSLLAFALLGGILGLGQFLAARSIARSAIWILVSGIALMLSWAIPSTTENLQVVGVVAGGLTYGIVTAAAMWWLARP